MNQKKIDRAEIITQKFLGLEMWKVRAENLMLLGLEEKANEALGEIIHVIRQLREINQEEVK
jgi:hypothetical protein